MAEQQKTVVVLGMERSGTSVVAKILKMIGVDMGPNVNITRSCPRGNYEDLEFVRLIKKIVKSAGGHHWEPPEIKDILALRKRFDKEVKALIERKSKGKQLWGWKYPWTLLVIDLFYPHLRNPHFVYVFRSPLGVARSAVLHTLGRVKLSQGLEVANFYNRRMAELLRKYNEVPSIMIDFEEAVEQPMKVAEQLGKFLGIEVPYKAKRKILKAVGDKKTVRREKMIATVKSLIWQEIPRAVWHRLQQLFKK